MDTFWIRIVSQSGVYIMFLVYFVWVTRRNATAWGPFLGTPGYAILFEHANMARYAHVQGGYHYHPASWLFVCGDVPLYIPLAWAFIVSTSMALTDRLRLAPYARPFCDALLALLIDLSMDAVAIRLRFWTWHGVPLQDGFFGVPADNFLGWLLVTFTFCALSRWLWSDPEPTRKSLPRRLCVQLLVVPPSAYILYLALEFVAHTTYHAFHAETLRSQYYVLVSILLGFLATILMGIRHLNPVKSARLTPESRITTGTTIWHETVLLHAPRQIFHCFALIGLLCVPLNARSPGLWPVAIGVWCLEIAILRSTNRIPPE